MLVLPLLPLPLLLRLLLLLLSLLRLLRLLLLLALRLRYGARGRGRRYRERKQYALEGISDCRSWKVGLGLKVGYRVGRLLASRSRFRRAYPGEIFNGVDEEMGKVRRRNILEKRLDVGEIPCWGAKKEGQEGEGE